LLNDGTLKLIVGTGGTARFNETIAGPVLNQGTWYHVAVVGSGPGSPVQLYVTPVVNGQVQQYTSASTFAGANGNYPTDAANPLDGPEVSHFKISAIQGGTLFQNDGVTPIHNGDFITNTQGNAGLKFTPTFQSIVPGRFTVQSSIGANDAGVAPLAAATTINI